MFGLCFFCGPFSVSDLGSPRKIYVRKFHADGIRWFNTLDNLEQFIVGDDVPPTFAGSGGLQMSETLGWAPRMGEKLYFYYFILLRLHL